MYYEITNEDWKLFRERIGGWQETYMGTLVESYIELLSGNKSSSEKFWELNRRIREDQKSAGVVVTLKRSEVIRNLASLILDGAIRDEDLEGFSQKTKERVRIQVAANRG